MKIQNESVEHASEPLTESKPLSSARFRVVPRLASRVAGNVASAEIMSLLEAFNREQGPNLIIVTHEFDFAAETIRIISMLDGRGDDNHHHRGAQAPGGEQWPNRVGQKRSQALGPPAD